MPEPERSSCTDAKVCFAQTRNLEAIKHTGPAWHDRELLVGARAGTVEILADLLVYDGFLSRGGEADAR
jgi:hypothetical protein